MMFWFAVKMLILFTTLFACCILLAILLLYLDRARLVRKAVRPKQAMVSAFDAACVRSYIGDRTIITAKDRYPKLKLKPPADDESDEDAYYQKTAW